MPSLLVIGSGFVWTFSFLGSRFCFRSMTCVSLCSHLCQCHYYLVYFMLSSSCLVLYFILCKCSFAVFFALLFKFALKSFHVFWGFNSSVLFSRWCFISCWAALPILLILLNMCLLFIRLIGHVHQPLPINGAFCSTNLTRTISWSVGIVVMHESQ